MEAPAAGGHPASWHPGPRPRLYKPLRLLQCALEFLKANINKTPENASLKSCQWAAGKEEGKELSWSSHPVPLSSKAHLCVFWVNTQEVTVPHGCMDPDAGAASHTSVPDPSMGVCVNSLRPLARSTGPDPERQIPPRPISKATASVCFLKVARMPYTVEQQEVPASQQVTVKGHTKQQLLSLLPQCLGRGLLPSHLHSGVPGTLLCPSHLSRRVSAPSLHSCPGKAWGAAFTVLGLNSLRSPRHGRSHGEQPIPLSKCSGHCFRTVGYAVTCLG
ncbi:uncharacterized protein LOC126065703 [Elephas maximus indicus]|uniref:uncharacterized protein LOC126065703 n=1 Tax=Elephas maximus indicus TaxID=99487 RepID=UPI002116F484|nr:uncharacterized protein LOC126065703 [Elephas maximus indicus]